LYEDNHKLKRIAKYSILLSIKESYLYLRNSLGLVFHPFKTLRALFREKDFSQIFLILATPLILVFFGVGSVWLGRRLVQAPQGDWGFKTKAGLLFTALSASAITAYLIYWLIPVIKVHWKKKKYRARSH
jgi:hypothetical protein